MKHTNFTVTPKPFDLNMAYALLKEVFGSSIHIDELSLKKSDDRDVAIQCIMDDKDFEQLFPNIDGPKWLDTRWSFICAIISEWLSTHTNLPIDFQIQKASKANKDYPELPEAYDTGLYLYFVRYYKQKEQEVKKSTNHSCIVCGTSNLVDSVLYYNPTHKLYNKPICNDCMSTIVDAWVQYKPSLHTFDLAEETKMSDTDCMYKKGIKDETK